MVLFFIAAGGREGSEGRGLPVVIEGAMLAIELSTARGQIAVMRGGELLHEAEFVSERSHNSLLFGPLGEALEAAGNSLSLIVVGAGPGSYTGVRIAIAAAQGIALSRNVPVIALPSVIAAAAADGLPSFGVIGDARRGQFYAVQVRDGKIEGKLRLLEAAAAAAWAASLDKSAWFTFDARLAIGADEPPVVTFPSARLLAKAAMNLPDADIQALASGVIEPFYVSEAFITKPKRPWLAVGSPS